MDLAYILHSAKTIAVVGCSRDPEKDAHRIPKYMQENGYRIIPVNPSANEILGERCYAKISDVNEAVDIVDIFRPSADVFAIVEDALKIHPKVIWTQLGIVSKEGKQLAERHGIIFIENKCIMVEHRKMQT